MFRRARFAQGFAVKRRVALVMAVAGLLWAAPAGADRARAREWVTQGEAAEARGDADAALALYERALAADPNYLRAYTAAAPLWLRAERYADAIAYLERATLRFPDYAFGWYTLAYAYRRVGRAEHAIGAYQSYIELRPAEAAPHFGLAMALKRAGHPARARAAFARYIQLERDPDRGDYVTAARAELSALANAGSDAGPSAAARSAAATAMVIAAVERHLDGGRAAMAEAEIGRLRSDAPRVEVLRARAALAVGHPGDALLHLYRATLARSVRLAVWALP